MNTLEKASIYIKTYFDNNFKPTGDYDMYVNKWCDEFGLQNHDFTINTSGELMEIINYCNQNSEYHNFNQDHTTVESIVNLYLTILAAQQIKLLAP